METRTQDQAALREQLGAGADTHAGSVELLRRATERQRSRSQARARVAMGDPPSAAVISRMVGEIGRA